MKQGQFIDGVIDISIAASVAHVSPSRAPSSGSTPVTVTGGGFDPASKYRCLLDYLSNVFPPALSCEQKRNRNTDVDESGHRRRHRHSRYHLVLTPRNRCKLGLPFAQHHCIQCCRLHFMRFDTKHLPHPLPQLPPWWYAQMHGWPCVWPGSLPTARQQHHHCVQPPIMDPHRVQCSLDDHYKTRRRSFSGGSGAFSV